MTYCTGVSAAWCPNCGDCACPEEDKLLYGLSSSQCPLHAFDAVHPIAEPPEQIPGQMSLFRQTTNDPA